MTATNQRELLERSDELSEIDAALARTASGEGQLVLIEAAAGTGKTALLRAAVGVAASDGARVLQAAGSELERAFAFGAVRQLLEPLLTLAELDKRTRMPRGATAPIGWLIDSEADPQDAAARALAGPAVMNAIYRLVADLGLDTPVVLAVDDLHWVDESSLRALAYIARRLIELPIALVGTLRPSEPGAPAALLDELRMMPGAVRLAPATLSLSAVTRLVQERIPDASAELCQAFSDESGGNPLYVRELLLWAHAGREADAAAVRRASIPALAERLARRIERVAPEAGQLAAMMSVLGDGASLALAAELAGSEETDAAVIASQLTELDVLASDDPVVFAHPLLRRSVYDRLPATARREAHVAAAALLHEAGAPAEMIAAHASEAPPSRSATVVSVLLEAARAAVLRAAPQAAIPLLERALAEGAAEPSRAELLFELGRAEMYGREPAAIPHLQQAFEQAQDDPVLRASIAMVLGDIMAAAGQWDSALKVLTSSLEGLDDEDSELAVELEVLRAAIISYDPRWVAEFNRNRARYERIAQGSTWAARALAALLASHASAACEGMEAVSAFADHALADGRLVAERGGGGWATGQVGPALIWGDHLDRAFELGADVERRGRADGSLIGISSGTALRMVVSCQRGNLAEAEAELRSYIELTAETGMAMWVSSVLASAGDAIVERSSLDDVAAYALAYEMDSVFLGTAAGGMLHELKGRIALTRHDRQAALGSFEACALINGPLGVGPTYSRWRSSLALLLPAGERSRAELLVAEELELARASGVARPEGAALRNAGLLAGGQEGIELMRESIAVLVGSPARLEQARTLVDLGAALRRNRQRGEAREHLAAGMDLADRCGADRLVWRAREELLAAGARPRRTARSGPGALTASQLRVARLAAAGHSNGEIADELYLSSKTVEAHLSSVYRKLGLPGRGGRAQLAVSLASEDAS